MVSMGANAVKCPVTIANPAKLGKHQTETVHPISVLFTPQQVQWLDRQRAAGLSRSAVIRLAVEEAMRRAKESK
jgi:hypothetical protein